MRSVDTHLIIRVISSAYPRPGNETSGVFVSQLVSAWRSENVSVEVVCRNTIGDYFRAKSRSRVSSLGPDPNFSVVQVIGKPFQDIIPKSLASWAEEFDESRQVAALSRHPLPHIFYAKFLVSGSIARKASLATGIPYFVDVGESSNLLSGDESSIEERRRVIKDAAGIVCVSPRLQDEVIQLGASHEKTKLIPNRPDRKRFRPLDKSMCRRNLGVDIQSFVVVFVGHFNYGKGAERLVRAARRAKSTIKLVLIGSGAIDVSGVDTLHVGPVPHDMLPTWLGAADAMVLPTLAEGCCNAIAEALACAVPIVTSDIRDVRWQVPEKGTILIDPLDVDLLSIVLDKLAGDPAYVAQLRAELLYSLPRLESTGREGEILDWMRSILLT